MTEKDFLGMFEDESSVPRIEFIHGGAPEFWPSNYPWPLPNGVSIEHEMQSLPPQWQLSDGNVVHGEWETIDRHQFSS